MSYELYTTKHWMILPSFVHGILPTLMYNSNNHIALGVMEKKKPYLVAIGGDSVIRDSQVTEDGTVVPRRNGWTGANLLALMNEPFVNVIPIDGPITRNGDACSYGSKDIRDWMMEAADNKYCRAHALVVNTPGGSAWAKNDFQQAIDFAHERGQRVYMLIDGLCASAGMYLASFCDEVYVVNLKDQLGCVGVMASFFTIKNGEKNQFDSETYHEYYATKSINKNKEYRDIAENDDATLLIAELDKLEDEFRSDMQAAFPAATDEHLDGKIFDASEVMGILCDGQMLLGDVIARAFAVANGDEEPIGRTAGRVIVAHEEEPENEPDEELAANAPGTAANINENNVSPKNNTTMENPKYHKIAQLLGVDELVVTEEGTFLNTPLLDKLSEKLEEMETATSPAPGPSPEGEGSEAEAEEAASPTPDPSPKGEGSEAEAEEATSPTPDPSHEGEGSEAEAEQAPAEEGTATRQYKPGEPADLHFVEKGQLDEAQAELAKATDALHEAEAKIAEKQEALDAATSDVAKANDELTEKQTAIDTLTKERDDAKATIDTLNQEKEANAKTIAEQTATIEKLTKQVADLKAEVKELSGKPAPMVDAAAGVPQDNAAAEAPKAKGSRIKRGMSYHEIREAMKG